MNSKNIHLLMSLSELDLTHLSLSLLKGLLILLAGWIFGRFISRYISKAIEKTKGKKEQLIFLNNFIFYGIIVLASMAALSEIEVDTKPLLAVLGGAALAVGLGLKDQLGQLTAGIILLIKHPFKIGDIITVAGQTGKVESIDFFQTILKTKENKKIIIPNNIATNGVITNFSGYAIRRIDLSVTISYSDKISLVKQILLNVAKEQPQVLDTPNPEAVMVNMQDHGVEMVLRCWVSSSNYKITRENLLERIKEAIEEGGCSIPFPQLVIHNSPEAV